MTSNVTYMKFYKGLVKLAVKHGSETWAWLD